MKCTRLSLSVPADLYDRMLNELSEENWSAIAAEAFRRALSGQSVEKRLIDLVDDNNSMRKLLANIHEATKDS